ncbi:MAG: crotonase/enoyl-CoA hydratase family protein [Microthrixaceae bacterium]
MSDPSTAASPATDPDSPSPVMTSIEGDVTVVTMDDGKANALSFDMIAALDAAIGGAFDAAKAVVLMGRAGKFCAGFDLRVMTSGIDNARELLGAGARLALRLAAAPIPVVLGVSGHALAMGGILLTVGDYRVGAEGAYKLGLNEVAIGMPVPLFAVELCRDRLSPPWFARCIQSAELCSPDTAVTAGFLDETVAADDVLSRSVEVAANLAATVHPGPFAQTRRAVRGDLLARLEALLANDLGGFEVST